MSKFENDLIIQERKLLRNENFVKSEEIAWKDAKWYLRKRYYVLFLIFWGEVVAFLLKLNFGIAIIEMTSDKNVTVENRTFVQKAEFQWNSIEKGILLSASSFGHYFSVIGGVLACKYGGTKVVGFTIAFMGISNILTPLLIRIHVIAFVFARACEGLAQHFNTAAMADIMFHWSPQNERVRFSAIAQSSHQLAPAISYPVLGYILKRYGWEVMYYVTGGCSMVWFCIWFAFISRSPRHDMLISKSEKNYLLKSINVPQDKKITYPWKKMVTSTAVWAYINERFVESWSASFVFLCLPLFIKDMQNIKIDKIGIISGIPSICAFVGLLLSSFVADHIRNKNRWNISDVHKTFITTAQIVCISALIMILVWMNFKVAIIGLAIFRLSYSVALSCYAVLPIDMGGEYASIIKGLSNTLRAFGAMLNPIIMGLLVPNHTVTEWTRYFIFLCAVNVWGMIIFCIFGSGELQPWATRTCKSKNENEN